MMQISCQGFFLAEENNQKSKKNEKIDALPTR